MIEVIWQVLYIIGCFIGCVALSCVLAPVVYKTELQHSKSWAYETLHYIPAVILTLVIILVLTNGQ